MKLTVVHYTLYMRLYHILIHALTNTLSIRIVGEDDGGKLFTTEEYEAYKKTVLPMRAQNRLFVSWRSPTGIDCKLVGPETPCFCTHRYLEIISNIGLLSS